jgi:hypothetical protein
MTEEQKAQREKLFFEWFDKAQAIADKNDVSIYVVYNARQIWDTAYATAVKEITGGVANG